MLATDPKKVRWLGIDLRPRWRRRVAVVATYIVFAVLIALVSEEADKGRLSGHHYLFLLAMGLVLYLGQMMSVFRTNGVVKSFDEPHRRKTRENITVGSLDEWAQYHYGAAGFEQATEEQQVELLRKYRMGNDRAPAKSDEASFLDERERNERDGISRWALMSLTTLLCTLAAVSALQRSPWSPFDVSTLFFFSVMLALTLPAARVLWIEPDPRDAGDLLLEESEA